MMCWDPRRAAATGFLTDAPGAGIRHRSTRGAGGPERDGCGSCRQMLDWRASGNGPSPNAPLRCVWRSSGRRARFRRRGGPNVPEQTRGDAAGAEVGRPGHGRRGRDRSIRARAAKVGRGTGRAWRPRTRRLYKRCVSRNPRIASATCWKLDSPTISPKWECAPNGSYSASSHSARRSASAAVTV